ncbi:MAG: ABC transporter permease [Rhizobiaceae bacterium]|nr:ABC transporter permease [Rhizobiaceae bacterium]
MSNSTADTRVGGGGLRPLQILQRAISSGYLVFALTILYVLAVWPFVPEILSRTNLVAILLQVIPLFIAAMGLMLVLMVAQIDLSATSIMALSCVVGASIITAQGGYMAGSPMATIVAIVVILAIGIAFGLLNGFCTAYMEMPSFLVTLTTMMFFSGAAIWYTALHTASGSSIGSLPGSFVQLGYGGIFGIPYAGIAAVLIGLGTHFLLTGTVFGRWIVAVGFNPRAALVSGIPVRRVIVWTFVISGICSAIAGIIYTARLEAGMPILGQRILLDIIGATVIGGVSLFGGTGRVLGVFFGVLFLSVVDNGLQLMGLSLSSVFAIKGSVILFAALLDVLRHKMVARS